MRWQVYQKGTLAINAIVLDWPRRARIESRYPCSEVGGIQAFREVVRHPLSLEDGGGGGDSRGSLWEESRGPGVP